MATRNRDDIQNLCLSYNPLYHVIFIGQKTPSATLRQTADPWGNNNQGADETELRTARLGVGLADDGTFGLQYVYGNYLLEGGLLRVTQRLDVGDDHHTRPASGTTRAD